jgi:hypothetical protein
MASGPWDRSYDESQHDALGAILNGWVASGLGLDDFRVLAQANAVFGRRGNARDLTGGDTPGMVAHARKLIQDREDRLAMLREFQRA